MRARVRSGICAFATLVTLGAAAANPTGDPQCKRDQYQLDGLPIWAQVDKVWDKTTENPLRESAEGARYRACWLTREQAASHDISCANAVPSTGDLHEFRFGYCASSDGHSETVHWTDPRFDTGDLVTASRFVVRFEPRRDGPREVPVYLRIERHKEVDDPKCKGKKLDDAAAWHFSVNGWVPAASDRRFKLDIHAGISQFSAGGSFADSFAEMRLRAETRLVESCRSSKKRSKDNSRPFRDRACIFDDDDGYTTYTHFLVRSYFDTALTSSSALRADDKMVTYTGARSIETGVGVGAGVSVPLSGSDGDTRRIAILAVARAGVRTLRDADAVMLPADVKARVDSVPFFTSLGLRLESEGGRFEGAYLEAGVGQSDQYVFHKSGRLKLDAYAPFTAPRTVALALRLQLDRYAPFGGSPRGTCPGISGEDAAATCAQLIRRGDVKISLLAQVDVRKLFNLLGFQQP